MTQTTVANNGIAVALGNVDWKLVVSVSSLTGVLSILTSIAGFPEVKEKKIEKNGMIWYS